MNTRRHTRGVGGIRRMPAALGTCSHNHVSAGGAKSVSVAAAVAIAGEVWFGLGVPV